MLSILPEYTTHKKNGKQLFFWFDDTGNLYYGPDESNLHFPSVEEINNKFPIAVKDLENAFRLGKGLPLC